MVKLEGNLLRFLTNEQFRVLVAIELGMRNHEIVPSPVIQKISALRRTGFSSIISSMLKMKLVHHETKPFDGYYLTYKGYDFLALKTFLKRDVFLGLGRKIGVGKEADVYTCYDNQENEICLKLERLGRTSFRQVKKKRGYMAKGQSCGNWLYLSRLAANKEYEIMKVLHEHGFSSPKPISYNRHAILMEYVGDAVLLNNIQKIEDEEDCRKIFQTCLDMVVNLAKCGLIHCDFNEFNLLVDMESQKVTMIDFPQMVSTNHENADELYERDLNCVHIFFLKRFNMKIEYSPKLSEIKKESDLDIKIKASGFDLEKSKLFKRVERKKRKEDAKNEERDEKEGEGEDSENEEEGEEGRKRKKKQFDEDFYIRMRIKRKIEREKERKKMIKIAKKKGKKGKSRKQYWDQQL